MKQSHPYLTQTKKENNFKVVYGRSVIASLPLDIPIRFHTDKDKSRNRIFSTAYTSHYTNSKDC